MDLFDMDEVEELVEKLTKYSEAYYGGTPLVSDQVYDAAENRLRELAPTNDYFNRVGAEIKGSTFKKVEHDILMLSLDKAYTIEEIMQWIKSNDLYEKSFGIVMPKMDGFALSLKYKLDNGGYTLVQAVTRGKGKSGDDVTENAKIVEDIPKRIELGSELDRVSEFEVRGEVYMKKSVFSELSLDKEFENCRNVAPGSIRQKDPMVTKARKLNFFAYNVYGLDCGGMKYKFEILKEFGFPVVDNRLVNFNFKEDLVAEFNLFECIREDLDYFIDGVVFMVENKEVYENLGNTSHHPKGAIAWKFEAEEGNTTFIEYQWQVSRTGLVNPVGIYEGIRIDGATLTNATMHNLSIVKALNIGVGDTVTVSRRGGVIPKIERVVKSLGRGPDIPTVCPACGSKLESNISDDGIETLHCVSLDCPAQVLTGILHFVSIMEIMDVGESIIAKMIENGFVNTYADLFKVTKSDLLTLESVKDKTAERTLTNINLARKKPLAVFLASLGIKNLGVNVSESIANYFENLDNVLKAETNDFLAIPGIATVMANNIFNGLKGKYEVIEALRKEIEIVSIQSKNFDGKLGGKSFLITGTLSEPRSYFEKLIKENGGVMKSSVSKTLDYLLVGNNAGSKLEKAKKVGVKIIFEDEFMKMIEN